MRHRFYFMWLSFAAVVSSSIPLMARAAAAGSPTLKATDLRCEYLVRPLGIDDLKPRLSWKLAPTTEDIRGQRQSAYRVLVASDRLLLAQNRGDLWDTGRIESDQSHLVAYGGKPLPSQMQCWWKVRVWDQCGSASDWSPDSRWSMGLLTPEAWEGARWIGLEEVVDPGIETGDIKAANWLWYPEGNAAVDAPVATRFFRRRITIPTGRAIVRAFCFFAGDDSISFYVNGALVGIGHGHSTLVGADLTGQLKRGANELAVAVTNADANPLANPAGWIGVVRVDFDRGEPLIIHSDASWKSAKAAVVKGEGVEVWHPRFRGNATRWAQIEGFPGTPTKDSFTGLVTHTDHEPVGEFACSSALINKVYLNARWGTRLQNRSVPMEPDRDERMPWSGHPAKTSESEAWVFNVARFYEHFLHNYRVHQAKDGSLQEILPPARLNMAFSQRILFPIAYLGRRSLTRPLAQATMNMAFGQGASMDPCIVPMADGSQTA